MAKRLTDAAVEKLKPDPERRREIPDAGKPGLYLIIQPRGRKSWAVRYRHQGQSKKYTLEGFPSLKTARKLAQAVLDEVAEGSDPAFVKKEAKHGDNLVANVVERFLKKDVAGKRTAAEIERMLKVDVLPSWGSRPIQEITRRDVLKLVDKLTDRGMTTGANRTFAAVRRLMNWSIARDIIKESPCTGIKPPAREIRRDQVLSDREIVWFWKATGEQGFPFGPLFRLLLLTGQRLSEVSEMTAGELNGRTWTIPRERAKNNLTHDVPMSDAAMAVIEAMPRIAGKPGLLFTTNSKNAVSGFNRAKDIIDRHMIALAKEEGVEEITEWRLHDLRRTAATGLQKLGIRFEVTEAVLNHLSGSKSGVAGVYQRHDWKTEKRAALEAWGRFVMALVEGRADNVVKLRQGTPDKPIR